MKSSIEMMSIANSSHQSPHSPRFEELAVVLPEHITQPSLRKMAHRIQEAMFQEGAVEHRSDCKEASIADNIVDNNLVRKLQQEGDQDFGEISRVKAILDYLVNTPNADAAVLVLITNEEHPQILFTRRAAHLSSHAGEVSFAGGKHDKGDGNNVVTALREACEETALPPNKAQIIGQLPTQISKKGLAVRPIIALVEPPVTYVPELGEIARIFWGDFEQLITQPTSDYILPYNMGGQTIQIKTPSWQVDGEVVWGLTGRILASLLEVSFDRHFDWYYEPVDV